MERIFVAATNNGGKLNEIRCILGSLGCEVISLKQANICCDPAEDGETFMENALIKAKEIKVHTDYAVVSDDSGVVVEALGGAPGVKTARYAGDDCDHERNIDKLLKDLNGLPVEKRRAWFVSAVAAVLPDGRVVTATGHCEGYIGFSKQGEGGFGYDPIFFTKENRSFAEISERRKNIVSHRARALRKLCFKLRGVSEIRGKI